MNHSQEKWDINLIGCWRCGASVANLIARYFDMIISPPAPDLWNIDRIHKELESGQSGLDRIYHHKTKEGFRIDIKAPVRVMVADCSPSLSRCLLADGAPGNTDKEILAVIDKLPWKPKPYKTKNKRRAFNEDGGVNIKYLKTIRARELDKKSDWGTVK